VAGDMNQITLMGILASAKPGSSELVADNGYHSRAVLKGLDGGMWKTRIAEPKQPGFSRWHGDDEARAAVYANRTRLGSRVGKQATASMPCSPPPAQLRPPLPLAGKAFAGAHPGALRGSIVPSARLKTAS
jgi:hypothetical protein